MSNPFPYDNFTPETADDLLNLWQHRIIIRTSREPGILPRIALRQLVPQVIDLYQGTKKYIETNLEVLPLDLDFQNTIMSRAGMNPVEAELLRRGYLLWIQIGQPGDWRLTIYKDYEGVKTHDKF